MNDHERLKSIHEQIQSQRRKQLNGEIGHSDILDNYVFLTGLVGRLQRELMELRISAEKDIPPVGIVFGDIPFRGPSAITRCEHYVDDVRVWCPPMCPTQTTARPGTSWKRFKFERRAKRDLRQAKKTVRRDGLHLMDARRFNP